MIQRQENPSSIRADRQILFIMRKWWGIWEKFHAQGKLHPLFRKLCHWNLLGKVNISQLIKTDVFIPPIEIRRQRSQHPIQRNRAHNTEIFTQRIGNHNGLSKPAVLWNQQFIKNFRTFKRIRHALADADDAL